MCIRDRCKTISIGIFIKIQWANFDELILFNCWLLNMFFPFSSVSNQTYLLHKNRYQLTVFDRLNNYLGSSERTWIWVFEPSCLCLLLMIRETRGVTYIQMMKNIIYGYFEG